jgi:hypothetical protein
VSARQHTDNVAFLFEEFSSNSHLQNRMFSGLRGSKCQGHDCSMKYGYARVSTDGQNPALQRAALKKAGCKWSSKNEGLSGATTKRPALLRCLKELSMLRSLG